MLVHRAFEVGGTVLPVPNPRIDGGVEEIGDQVGEDDTDYHGDDVCFIQQESWHASEKPVSRDSRICPRPYRREYGKARLTPSSPLQLRPAKILEKMRLGRW